MINRSSFGSEIVLEIVRRCCFQTCPLSEVAIIACIKASSEELLSWSFFCEAVFDRSVDSFHWHNRKGCDFVECVTCRQYNYDQHGASFEIQSGVRGCFVRGPLRGPAVVSCWWHRKVGDVVAWPADLLVTTAVCSAITMATGLTSAIQSSFEAPFVSGVEEITSSMCVHIDLMSRPRMSVNCEWEQKGWSLVAMGTIVWKIVPRNCRTKRRG